MANTDNTAIHKADGWVGVITASGAPVAAYMSCARSGTEWAIVAGTPPVALTGNKFDGSTRELQLPDGTTLYCRTDKHEAIIVTTEL
jgi:hypothetical protein